MSLTVLSVAYPFATVGDHAAGGAEQVLSLLDAGLVRRGHRSLVVACRGSRVTGELVATPAYDTTIDATLQREAWTRHREAVEAVLEREPVDLVHLHGHDFHAYLPRPGVPALATLHLPPHRYPEAALRPARQQTWLQCVSGAQRRACPPWAAVDDVVENGVDVGRLTARDREAPRLPAPRTYVAAIGRICLEKGFHLAIDAARRADVPLCLAGHVFPYADHRDYFECEIRPRLDDRRIFVGPVDFEAKRDLLAGARCVLVPSLVDETSSLVAMEALACGTPVIAYWRGALPEIVEHGRTGFLVTNVEGMAAAIGRIGGIDREACREAARRRFSAGAMLDRYLALYGQLLGGRPPARVEYRQEPPRGPEVQVDHGTREAELAPCACC